MPTSPDRIEIKSDGNVLQLISCSKGFIVYEYVVSESKLSKELILTQELLDKMIRMEICKIILK